MPIIKPISDLRNHFSEIAEICTKENEPIFLTKNGQGELVIMSLPYYEEQQARLELYQKLNEAENESKITKTRVKHQDLIKKLSLKANDSI